MKSVVFLFTLVIVLLIATVKINQFNTKRTAEISILQTKLDTTVNKIDTFTALHAQLVKRSAGVATFNSVWSAALTRNKPETWVADIADYTDRNSITTMDSLPPKPLSEGNSKYYYLGQPISAVRIQRKYVANSIQSVYKLLATVENSFPLFRRERLEVNLNPMGQFLITLYGIMSDPMTHPIAPHSDAAMHTEPLVWDFLNIAPTEHKLSLLDNITSPFKVAPKFDTTVKKIDEKMAVKQTWLTVTQEKIIKSMNDLVGGVIVSPTGAQHVLLDGYIYGVGDEVAVKDIDGNVSIKSIKSEEVVFHVRGPIYALDYTYRLTQK